MSTKSTSRPAWAPWTFKGVAGYAHASARRLFITGALVNCGVAASALIFVVFAWLPALDRAATRLPEYAAITQGTLQWPGMLPQQLTDSSFLGIVVVNQLSSEVGQVADIQIELARRKWRIRSLLGYMEFTYPQGWRVELSRKETEPWWGARRPFAATLVCIGSFITMPLMWGLIALVYAPVPKTLALFGNRQLSLFGAWKMSCAALMPGTVLMSVLLAVYGFQRLPLAGLLGGVVIHLVVGWVYLLVTPFRLPKSSGSSGKSRDPFGGGKKRANPFGD